jgi:4-hydroxybenzoate polyprenyltransferase
VSPRPTLTQILRALRPLDWSKNVLIFAPLGLNHHFSDLERLKSGVIAFVAFCFAASGTYLLNDYFDLESDKQHPTKRNRPVASGAISPTLAITLGIALSIAGLAISSFDGYQVFAIVAGYEVITLLYSTALKRKPILDVLTLSALYAIRVIAGGIATRVEVSDWLLALCAFLFVSLAMLKRYSDLRLIGAAGESPAGRGYTVADADLLRGFGIASGTMSILVFALYLTSPKVTQFYSSPRMLWFICPLMMYWLMHMWLLAHRGTVTNDPIIVAVKEPASWIVAIAIAAIAVAAI